jgi:hypothetical protein
MFRSFRRWVFGFGLVLILVSCVSGREKLAGPGVKSMPTAMIKVLSTTPVSEIHDVISGTDTVRILVETSSEPKAIAILFAGGRGPTGITNDGFITKLSGNFLVRSRHSFWFEDIMTAVFDSPASVTQDLRPIHDGQGFADDVGAVINHLRKTYNLPVWVVGTSRGTVAAANAAARLGDKGPDGVVFTSSLFYGGRTASVFDLPLEKVRIPSLIVHHKQDGCQYTSPTSVPIFQSKLTNARAVEVIWIEGGSAGRNPCQASGYHGFKTLEGSVVRKISSWIKTHN